jgi:hypothetical protein
MRKRKIADLTEKEKSKTPQMFIEIPKEFRDEIDVVMGNAGDAPERIQKRALEKAKKGDKTPLFINLFRNFGDEKPFKVHRVCCIEVEEE